MSEPLKRISIIEAKASGLYEQYRAVARHEDAEYLRVPKSAVDRIKAKPSIIQHIANVARTATGAARSIVRTTRKSHRATAPEQAQRLAICDACPHVVRKDGKPSSCGPFLSFLRMKRAPGCGCLLDQKTLDIKQACPEGRWHRIVRLLQIS